MYRIGEKVWYRGAWNSAPAQPATIVGVGEKNDRLVYDCELQNGAHHWGYSDQFSRDFPVPRTGSFSRAAAELNRR